MIRRPCLDCGTLATGTRCPTCTSRRNAERSAKLDKPNRYGTAHRATRAAWAPVVASGGVACTACRQPIAPDEPWDLGHNNGGPSTPWHRRCNRGVWGRAVEFSER